MANQSTSGPWRQIEGKLMIISRGLRRAYDDRLALLGLKMSEASALVLVDGRGPMTQAQLAMELAIGQASTGAVVDALERRALISREPDPRDRRAWLVTATTDTHAMVKSIVAIDREIGRELRHGMSEGAIKDLEDTLVAIGENIDSMLQSGSATTEKKT